MRRPFSSRFTYRSSLAATPSLRSSPNLYFDGQFLVGPRRSFFADDNMGRPRTGSAGLRRAQAYVVEQLKKKTASNPLARWLLSTR